VLALSVNSFSIYCLVIDDVMSIFCNYASVFQVLSVSFFLSYNLYYLLLLFCYIVMFGHLALRIHISDTTAELLQDYGGFSLEYRGIQEVKVR